MYVNFHIYTCTFIFIKVCWFLYIHIPGGNATDPIWRVLASSQWISSWTSLKPQHSYPNPNAFGQSILVYWLPYSSHTSHHPAQTPCLPWISYATQKLMLDSCKMGRKAVWSIPYVSVAFFPSLKQNFIAYRSSKVSDCIFEIHELWQSGFSRLYSNSYCSRSFEPEILKIDPSSHKMNSNNTVNFQESTIILNAHTKKVWHTYRMHLVYIYIYIYIYICIYIFLLRKKQNRSH